MSLWLMKRTSAWDFSGVQNWSKKMSNYEIVDEKCDKVLERFKNRHRELVPLVTKMPSVALRQANSDDFKRDFIIYIISSLIHCPTTRRCQYRLMKNLLDASHIKNYNWCRFIMKGLIEMVDGWKHNQGNHICQPMIFLVVIYVSCSFFFLGTIFFYFVIL